MPIKARADQLALAFNVSAPKCAPAECPLTITDAEGMTVPQPPQGAVDGMARLVPNRDVASLVVCSYPVLDMMTGSLPESRIRLRRSSKRGSPHIGRRR